MRRIPIPDSVRLEVLKKCRRRCCMCYGLDNDLGRKDGQIAHLDRDPSNIDPENLVFLCSTCHPVYDKKSNRVLGFTPGEVRYYRDRLFTALGLDIVEVSFVIRAGRSQYNAYKEVINKAHSILSESIPDVTRTERSLES